MSRPVAKSDRQFWAHEIAQALDRSVKALIQVGRLLSQAKEALPHGEFIAMVESDLSFDIRTAQRFMAIGEDSKLSNTTHVSHLPNRWGTLYELTRVDEPVFEEAIQSGEIHPKMTRKDAQRIANRAAVSPPDARLVEEVHSAAVSGRNGEANTGRALEPPQLLKSVERPNGARSIMAARHEPDDSLDFFPTPPWATRALIQRVFPWLGHYHKCRDQTVWEPACGEGHMAEVLNEYFDQVLATDIHDYGYGHVQDFLVAPDVLPADWIITNPPFNKLTEPFVLKALELASVGVAMFVRLQWLETIGRYERIFRDNPPTLIVFYAERVPCHEGRWEPEGDTATAYIWLIWVKGRAPLAPFWIPPGCRKELTKSDDVERFTAHPVIKKDHSISQIPASVASSGPSEESINRIADSADQLAGTGTPGPLCGKEVPATVKRFDDYPEMPAFLRRSAA